MLRKIWSYIKVPHTWAVILPYHILTVYGIWLLAAGLANPLWLLGTAVGCYVLFDLTTEGFLHRELSHTAQAVKTRFLWYVGMLLGIIAGQGSALFWAGHHRSLHHPFSDTVKDPHSPVAHSWWTAYLGWLINVKPDREILRHAKVLLREPFIKHTHRFYGLWLAGLWGALLLIPSLLFGWTAGLHFFVFCVMIPCFYALHCFNLVNVFGHVPEVTIFGIKIKLGYRNFKTRDQSVNVPWLWPLVRGVAWHNNHHGKQASAHYGGEKPWEFDPLYHVSGLYCKKRNRIIRKETLRKAA